MLQIKTSNGFTLPDKIFYRLGTEYVEVKKIFSSQESLERGVLCDCEHQLSALKKELYRLFLVNEELTNYLPDGSEKNQILLQQESLASEIQSIDIEQIELNKQITILDSNTNMKIKVLPTVNGLLKLSTFMIDNPTAVVIKMTPSGTEAKNPDVIYGLGTTNPTLFKYEGNYYKISTPDLQETDIIKIKSDFGGDTNVIIEVISGNTFINTLRNDTKAKVQTNITMLDKVAVQQGLINNKLSERKVDVAIKPSYITEHTDNFMNLFYGSSSITEIDGTASTNLLTNVELKKSNIAVGLNIDVNSPVNNTIIETLKDKSVQILGHINLSQGLKLSTTVGVTSFEQVFSSSDIFEFKFKTLGRVSAGADIVTNNIKYLSGGSYNINTYESLIVSNYISGEPIIYDNTGIGTTYGVYYYGAPKTIDGLIIKIKNPNSYGITADTYTNLTINNSIIYMNPTNGGYLFSSYGNIYLNNVVVIVDDDAVYSEKHIYRGVIQYNNVQILKRSQASEYIKLFEPYTVESSSHSKIIVEKSANIFNLVSNSKCYVNDEIISEIISEQMDKIFNISSNLNLSTNKHTRILSKMTDDYIDLTENVTLGAVKHTRVISRSSDVIQNFQDNVKLEVNHPELIANIESNVIDLGEMVKVNVDIKSIVSNVDSSIIDLGENVFTINDPIPFTVYQQAVVLNTLNKPLIITDSIDNFGVVLKNVGAVCRINPISVAISKIPNYISTQTNMTDVLEYSLSNTTVSSMNSFIVSQLNSSSINRLNKPIIETQDKDTFISALKGYDVVEFNYNVIEKDDSMFVVSAVSSETVTLNNVAKSYNITDNYIVSLLVSNDIEFEFNVEQATINTEKIISVKSNKVVSISGGELDLRNESVEKIISVKSNKVILFSGDINTTLSSENTPFKIYNGNFISDDNENYIIIRDLNDTNNYKVYSDNGEIKSELTTSAVTNNEYLWDEATLKMYRLTSSNGYLDVAQV